MLRTISSKYYFISILFVLLIVAGYSVLAYFLKQQNHSVKLAQETLQLERDFSTLNKNFMEARYWQQEILSAKSNNNAEAKYAQLLEQVTKLLDSLREEQGLSPATQNNLTLISEKIADHKQLFNALVQLKTRQRLQATRMETHYRSLASITMNSKDVSLLKPLSVVSHFLNTFREGGSPSSYQALKLVVESFEKKITAQGQTDIRIFDYLGNFKSLIDQNYTMHLDIAKKDEDIKLIDKNIQELFIVFSSELETVIVNKLQDSVNIRDKLKIVLFISIVISALTLFWALRHLLRGIIAPIRSMSKVMEDIKEGRLTARFTSHTQKDDEIVQLGLTFNNMLDTLEEKNRELLAYQQDLEGKINELSQREAEQKQLTAKIQRIEKMEAVGTLAGGVAHDLNNILSGIVSYPDLLLLELPKESPLRKPILTIQESGKKASTIVQDLLTLARRGVTVTEITNLNTLIQDYLQSPEHQKLKSLFPDLKIPLDLAKDLPNISGSPVHITKTIMNLVANGAESTETAGEVTIQTSSEYLSAPIPGYSEITEGNYVVLKISDNGVGISAENIERIFEPFFTKKEMGRSGTGLGLAVVWGTIEDHSGYIDVQSTKNKGTTFTIYLPATEQQVEKPANALPVEQYLGNKQKILVVDDIESQREIATGILQRLQYSVAAVASGEEAVQYLKNNTADLVILDMIMDPGIDGFETYLKILEINPSQKAIITSGYSETGRVKKAQQAGARTYIRKPYTMEKLGLAIKEELER